MIFALKDYITYKKRAGRFSKDLRYGPMAAAWDNEIPDHIFEILDDGDPLFFQTLNSVSAWAVMYATSSGVSHIGLYVHDRKILHMTPPGSVLEPIKNCFGENVRILPGKLGKVLPNRRENLQEWASDKLGEPYGYLTVIKKGCRIFTGRDPQYFRWKFFLDVVFLCIFLDIPVIFFHLKPIFSYLIIPYSILVAFNIILSRYKPLPAELMGGPVDGFRFIEHTNGRLIGDAYAVRNQNHGAPIYRYESNKS